jgi:hypothetical protein
MCEHEARRVAHPIGRGGGMVTEPQAGQIGIVSELRAARLTGRFSSRLMRIVRRSASEIDNDHDWRLLLRSPEI